MEDWVNRQRIQKGWSEDKKYCVTNKKGEKFLLRIAPREKSMKCEEMFNLMKEVSQLGISMCHPVEFGFCEEGAYTIQSWIDGNEVVEVLGRISKLEQYSYGIKAGEMLKMIHKIPAPSSVEDWETRFNRKMDLKIKMYMNCPMKFENGKLFIKYIEQHRYLLKNRPQTFQHGDYHIGNMMLNLNNELFIIDFDRFDFGDPWEEFNRIVWCAQKSPLFATGMVNGYFNDDVPSEFWRLLALYISSNTLSSLAWAAEFGSDEIDTMHNQAQQILQWYNNMQSFVPSWYIKLLD